ncbi:MAG: Uma2 family endonuclease [Lachnospiraceae bacterium]|nr:Uma2 family endonuclease [Lachnospiraceae bacterium]
MTSEYTIHQVAHMDNHAEITSEATRTHDYKDKLRTYKKIGVSEYWIVDIQDNAVFKYISEQDYAPVSFIQPEVVPVSVFSGFDVDLSRYMCL